MNDIFFMKEAIKQAKNGVGFVNPNPLVGSIIVKNSKIIGTGYHKKFGNSHAEINALKQAGKKSENATIYITLEPCFHHGKTPPCVDVIISAGITRCVIASKDPNPKVNGKSIKKLRENGVEVDVSVCKEEAKEIIKPFFKFIRTKLPFVYLKLGITLDGKIATASYNSKWITNTSARHHSHQLRSKYMSLLVGANTIIKDNPSLTCRIKGKNNPYRIILDGNLKIPKTSKVLKNNEDKKTIIITSKDNKKKSINYNANFIFLKGKKFSFKEILVALGKLNIDSILVEGGNKIISQAFKENIIDEGDIIVAPKIIGDSKAVSFVSGFSTNLIKDSIYLKNLEIKKIGNNVCFHFKKS